MDASYLRRQYETRKHEIQRRLQEFGQMKEKDEKETEKKVPPAQPPEPAMEKPKAEATPDKKPEAMPKKKKQGTVS